MLVLLLKACLVSKFISVCCVSRLVGTSSMGMDLYVCVVSSSVHIWM